MIKVHDKQDVLMDKKNTASTYITRNGWLIQKQKVLLNISLMILSLDHQSDMQSRTSVWFTVDPNRCLSVRPLQLFKKATLTVTAVYQRTI